MASSRGEAVNLAHQIPRTLQAPIVVQIGDSGSICKLCGIEWFSEQKLQRQTGIFQTQNAILNDSLYRAGHANQLQEIRLRDCDRHIQELSQAKNVSDQAILSLQEELQTQQIKIESETREHVLAAQALNHEFKCHAKTENDRDHERAMAWKMAEILNTLSSNNGNLSAALPNEVGLGTMLHEWENMKHERTNILEQLQHQIKKLQHNQQIHEHLSEDSEGKSESTCSYSGEDVEIISAVILPPVGERQGKRRRNQ
ncbi:MAG: hypothetical protein Q9187_001634 [Circinaria calcarea]